MRQASLEHRMSRYACCTQGVLDHCVRAVAAEAGLEDVIPGWSGHQVALVAHDALEALEMTASIGDRLMAREVRKGDWTLAVLAELRFIVSVRHRDLKQTALATAAYERALVAIEDAAASEARSPVLFYEDILFDAAQALVRRGDRTGLVRQTECVAEALRVRDGGNVRGTMRDLALFHLDLAEHRAGLSLLGALLRHCPSDPWTYNVIAIRFAHYGLPSLARLAAERGLALVRRGGDPEGLAGQLTEVIREVASSADRSDAPANAIEELRDALHVDFDEVSPVTPGALAIQLVPGVATARVKELPPVPTDMALSSTAARLRGFMKAASRTTTHVRPAAPVFPMVPHAPQTGARKVGRNDPCPCGSGRKFKKCCLS